MLPLSGPWPFVYHFGERPYISAGSTARFTFAARGVGAFCAWIVIGVRIHMRWRGYLLQQFLGEVIGRASVRIVDLALLFLCLRVLFLIGSIAISEEPRVLRKIILQCLKALM